MAGNLIIWLTLVYLINFGSTEIDLVFSANACNRTCANLDFADECNVDGLEPGLQCPGVVNNKNECVYQCEPDEVICQKANRTYTSCSSTCHTTCANQYTNFMEPCNFMCFIGCGCSAGYVLNADGECVLPENCNPKEIECPEHTTFNECGKGVMRTCFNYREEITERSVCIPTCSCPDNLVFDAKTRTCVDETVCQDSEENQGIELIYVANPCNTTCANLDIGGDSCDVDDLVYGLQCPGYVNSKNVCVYECEAHEVICQNENRTYTSCGSACQTTCGDMYTNSVQACPAMCFMDGCGCSDGYILNATKDCILPQNCNPSEVECPKQTTFNECGNGVMRTCQNQREGIKEITTCIPTCSCPDNLVYDAETDTCVDIKFCYDSQENKECMEKHGFGSRYSCDGDKCSCLCTDWYILDLDTELCEIDWDFAFDG